MSVWSNWCGIWGHNWFPGMLSEFLVTRDICLRCNAERVTLPWGDCLGGHPLADHYDDRGSPVNFEKCGRPL